MCDTPEFIYMVCLEQWLAHVFQLNYHCLVIVFILCPSAELLEELSKALRLSRHKSVFVGEQADTGDPGSYLKKLGFQKLNLGLRQTSRLLIVSYALGQRSLLQLHGLQLKNLRHEGAERKRRAVNYQMREEKKGLHSRSCCLFSKSQISKITPAKHYSTGKRREQKRKRTLH